MHADVVDECGAPQGHDLPVRESAPLSGYGGQASHRAGMTCPGRGPQVGEVGHRFQGRVECMLAQRAAQTRLGLDQRLELGHGVQVGEDGRCFLAEQVHQPRLKMRAPAGSGHLDGGFNATRPVEHLNGVGQVE